MSVRYLSWISEYLVLLIYRLNISKRAIQFDTHSFVICDSPMAPVQRPTGFLVYQQGVDSIYVSRSSRMRGRMKAEEKEEAFQVFFVRTNQSKSKQLVFQGFIMRKSLEAL